MVEFGLSLGSFGAADFKRRGWLHTCSVFALVLSVGQRLAHCWYCLVDRGISLGSVLLSDFKPRAWLETGSVVGLC